MWLTVLHDQPSPSCPVTGHATRSLAHHSPARVAFFRYSNVSVPCFMALYELFPLSYCSLPPFSGMIRSAYLPQGQPSPNLQSKLNFSAELSHNIWNFPLIDLVTFIISFMTIFMITYFLLVLYQTICFMKPCLFCSSSLPTVSIKMPS